MRLAFSGDTSIRLGISVYAFPGDMTLRSGDMMLRSPGGNAFRSWSIAYTWKEKEESVQLALLPGDFGIRFGDFSIRFGDFSIRFGDFNIRTPTAISLYLNELRAFNFHYRYI